MRIKKTLADFPHLLAEWHPTRNGDIEASGVASCSQKKRWWLCKRSHVWDAIVSNRSRHGRGCPVCSGRNVTPESCLANLNKELASQWHPTRNGALTPQDVNSGTHKIAEWLCPRGHEWSAEVKSRMAGSGCPYCANRIVSPENNLAFVSPHLVNEWHPTRNGDLTPHDVLAYSHMKVWWLCRYSHSWQASPNKRNQGRGCPVCNESLGEKTIEAHLKNIGVYYSSQFRFTNCKSIKTLPFDFVILPDGKDAGVIEFQGEQHFRPIKRFGGESSFVQVQIRDQIKRDFCEEKNLALLEIPYTEIKLIPQLIDEFVESLPRRRTF